MRWNLAAGLLGTAWAALMGLVFLPLYIRYLGTEGWGVVGFCLTLQAWMSMVDSGTSPALNRELARFRGGLRDVVGTADLVRSAELLYLAIGAVAVLLVAAASSWLASAWLRGETLAPQAIAAGLRWMGLVIAFQWLASLYRHALLGLQLQVFPHLTAAVVATARGLLTWAALYAIAPTVEVFVGVQLAATAAEALALRRQLRRSVPQCRQGRWSLAALAELRQFAAGLTGIALLAVLLTQGDKLLLSKLLSLQDFGFVMLAVTVAGALALIAAPVFNLCYARLSELAGRPEAAARLADEYHRWSQLLAVLVLAPAAVLAFFAHDLLQLWTRNATLATAVAPLLSLWVVGQALNALVSVPYAAQLAHGWTRLGLVVNAVAVAVLAPVTLWLVPAFGAIAAGWIWVAINLGYVVVEVLLMHRQILRGEAARWYVQSLLAPLLASGAVAAAFAAWRRRHDAIPEPALLALIVACGICAALAALAVAPRPRDSAIRWLRSRA